MASGQSEEVICGPGQGWGHFANELVPVSSIARTKSVLFYSRFLRLNREGALLLLPGFRQSDVSPNKLKNFPWNSFDNWTEFSLAIRTRVTILKSTMAVSITALIRIGSQPGFDMFSQKADTRGAKQIVVENKETIKFYSLMSAAAVVSCLRPLLILFNSFTWNS